MNLTRALSLLLWLAPLVVQAADLTFIGRAHALDTGALLYVESHSVAGAGEAREFRVVSYRCANGAVFARKTLDFNGARLAPAFALVDARSGVSEGLERVAPGMISVFERAPGAPARSKALNEIPGLVADAGFDEFVRARWDALEAGDALVVPFVVPSRLGAVSFRVRKTGATTIDGQEASVFRLSVAGALGWFLPDIDVSYRRGDRRLLRYRGITNLRDSAGEMISAQIDFADADRSTAAVDLVALRAQPLSRTCGS
jgi:hypothetical protein